MSDPKTPHLGLTKPIVGDEAGEDLWGEKINLDLDILDANALTNSTKPEEAPLDGGIYGRRGADASWQSISALEWDDIQDKPVTFPPTLPIPISGVTGLQSELDARATDAELNAEISARTDADVGLQSTINTKEPAIAPGTTSQFWRGDKTWASVPAPTDSYTKTESDARYVDAGGDSMSGALVLPGDPTQNLQAAPKQYVDLKAGAGLAEAPLDGKQYARQSAAWTIVTGGATISDTPPASPTTGQLWFESDSGALMLRYADPVGGETWWVQINTTPVPSYDLSFSWENLTPANETMARFVTPRAFTVPTNAAGSYAKAAVAATASTTYTAKKNGTSIGTIVFAAAGTSGTFTITQTAFAAGDVLTIDGPATADTTLADVAITLVTT